MRRALPVFVAGTVVLGALGASPSLARAQSAPVDEYRQLRNEWVERDQTIWADELLAQEYEGYFIQLWDDLRTQPDRFATLASAPFTKSIMVGTNSSSTESVGSGVERRSLDEGRRELSPSEWREFVESVRSHGFEIDHTEWHHAEFNPGDSASDQPRSLFSFTIHARRPALDERHELNGKLSVQWSSERDGFGNRMPKTIEVDEVTVTSRTGAAPFSTAFEVTLEHRSPRDDFLIDDFDGDGDTDFAYPPTNDLFLNRGDATFDRAPLCAKPTKWVYEAAFADFTGDGEVDLLVAGSNPIGPQAPERMGLFLYERSSNGAFAEPARLVIDPAAVDLREPEAFAIGDVDGDGDLDLWIAQYLSPYVGGQFPDPYYDANDGLPAYLLLNNGDGSFVDATETSGLAPKRWRRTFRSSFVDLDGDADLDLVVVSDFAGVDLYLNDGAGHFDDVTATLIDEPANFGMSHVFGDFNRDGRLDFYVTGMASTTARRLARMGLGREDLPEYQDARLKIAYGNRLYLQTSAGTFEQPAYNDSVARSGWAWGCAKLDIENDGDLDLYVTNGNRSGKSSRDYCTNFWRHDIYAKTDEHGLGLNQIFSEFGQGLATGEISWNGFEYNRLFMNRGEEGFATVPYLMGVGFTEDCRAAVADDFDLDGRPDLFVVAYDRSQEFSPRVARVMRNEWADPGAWVGVRLRGAPGVSPIGATITVKWPGGVLTDAIVSGDSAKCQGSTLRHFGLGEAESVDSIEIRWPDGSVSTLENPTIDAYHDVRPAGG
ncbi:MAG: CRTAC1 family protein [Phycisphaerales bacterium]